MFRIRFHGRGAPIFAYVRADQSPVNEHGMIRALLTSKCALMLTGIMLASDEPESV